FNPETLRMEVTSFVEVLFNPVAQAKFVHTVAAGYVTGAVFVLSISAWYLLRGRHLEIAKRSLTVAASFGLAAALSVVVLGDESGYALTDNQKMKLAMIEGAWETEAAPAPFTLVGLPNRETQSTEYSVEIPWVMGLIATRSVNEKVPGMLELMAVAEDHIDSGLIAYAALETLKEKPNDRAGREAFIQHQEHMRYALLLKNYVDNPLDATPEHKAAVMMDTLPNVASLFWAFRFMVAIGFFFILLFGLGFYYASTRNLENNKWFLRIALFSLPLPWLGVELGWFVAEYGRQPWVIEGVLPTFLGASNLAVSDLLISIAGFFAIYTVLAIIEIRLMLKFIRLGPVAEGQGAKQEKSLAFEPDHA